MNKVETKKGRLYGVCCGGDCVVTDDETGNQLLSLDGSKQEVFIAPGSAVWVTDDSAVVTELFKLAPCHGVAAMLLLRKAGGWLPKGYVELEYMESSGTQYIDTGVVTDGHYTIACRVQITRGSIWGRVQDTPGDLHNKPTSWARYSGKNGNVEAGLNFYYQRQGIVFNVSTDSSPSWDLAYPHDWVAKEDQKQGIQAVVMLDGQRVLTRGLGGSILDASNPGRLSHYIFWASGEYPQTIAKAVMQLYRFTMIDGKENTVFDGVPVLRLADNVAGLWDKVSGQFFLPPAGTGTFGWQLKNVPAAAAYSLRGRSKPGYMPPSGIWARPAGVNGLEVVADTEEVSGEGWLHFDDSAAAEEHFGVVQEEILTE